MGGESPSTAVVILSWVIALCLIGPGLYFVVTGEFQLGKSKFAGTTARVIGVAMVLFGLFNIPR
jgi:hypothetical protein